MEEVPRATGAQVTSQDEGAFWRELNQFWDRLVRCHNDVDALVAVIAERVMDVLGDGCVVTRVTADGTALHAIAVEHRDPAVGAAMRAVLAAADTAVGEGVAGSVAADRRSVVLNDLPAAVVEETTPPQYLPFVRDHPMRALLVVPLVARGELVGTLGAVRTSSAEPYTTDDLRLLEAFGERAALALGEAIASPRRVGASDFEALYRHNLDGVLISTPDGHILAANPAACDLLRASEREIVDAGREGLMVAEDPNLERALSERASTGRARAELTMRRFDGSHFVADVSSTIFSTIDDSVRAVVIFRDITEQVTARKRLLAHFAELEQAAERDPLTGLWNRRGLLAAAHQALARADREEVPVQVLFLDLVGLKALNDQQGHRAGDAAIRAVAGAIGAATREADVTGRWGGDEFVLLLVDTAATDVDAVIERIAHGLAADPDAPTSTAFSAGRTERRPGDERTLGDLIDAADRDMYQTRLVQRLREQS